MRGRVQDLKTFGKVISYFLYKKKYLHQIDFNLTCMQPVLHIVYYNFHGYDIEITTQFQVIDKIVEKVLSS